MEDGKLDAFRPSLETLSGIRRQLVDAGIPTEQIPEDWLIAITAAMTKWISRDRHGMAFVVNALGFRWKTGDDDKIYRYIEPTTQNVYEIDPKQVHFFAGAAVRGVPTDPTNVEITERITEQCDGCGISAHCLTDIRDPVSDRIERLCNNCRTLSDNPRVRDKGDPMVCEECTVRDCYHHPRHMKRLGS